MPQTFLHGVEIVEIDTGPRPIRTARSSVVGIVGTAPNADPAAFPINTPVLVAGNRTLATSTTSSTPARCRRPWTASSIRSVRWLPLFVSKRAPTPRQRPQT
jgi:phage tail sheath protein FI